MLKLITTAIGVNVTNGLGATYKDTATEATEMI